MKIENMMSTNGNVVPNQFIITDYTDTGKTIMYFQSYRSIICKLENGKTYLDVKYWDYSKTTGKYRNIFLEEKKADTMKKIASGEYILTNLNKD